MKSKILLSALTLLGFSGCSEEGKLGELFDEPDMYGVPLVDYRFIGSVTDAGGNPIKGIEVKVSSAKDAVVTDDEGDFKADFNAFANGFHSVAFTDVDGSENGGEFASKQVDVTNDDAQSDDRDIYNLGTIKLDAKEK